MAYKTGAAAPRADFRKAAALVRELRTSPRVSLTGVTGSSSAPCEVRGSYTVSYRFADTDGGAITTGDYTSLTFNSCYDGYFTLTGTVKVEYTGTDGLDPQGDPSLLTSGFEYGYRVTMIGFTMKADDGTYSTSSGDVKLSLVWDATARTLSEAISGAAISGEYGDASGPLESSLIAPIPGTSRYSMHSTQTFLDDYAFDLASDAWGMSARVCTLDLGGCLDVAVDPQLVTYVPNSYPSSGTLKVTGANGAYVQVQANSGDGAVTLTYDVDPSDLPTAPVTIETTWYCLDYPYACQ